MPPDIEIRHCHSLAEYDECVRLELSIWGESIAVPAPIFVVAHHTGGQVLGAFDGARLVGCTLALAGIRRSMPFLHSHMTAVLPEYQNRGIGRRLKLFQRQDALRRGIRVVEWTFDPLELKNAHFNLARLGAVVRRYLPNCYGITESPLHAGLPTDRLIAEWWLDSPRVQGILADDPFPSRGEPVHIGLPSNFAEIKSQDRAAATRIQSTLREQFLEWFAKDYVAAGIESRGETTVYLIEPRSTLAGLDLPEAVKE
jgi:predicted GNAT superfamily acetyltransferase